MLKQPTSAHGALANTGSRRARDPARDTSPRKEISASSRRLLYLSSLADLFDTVQPTTTPDQGGDDHADPESNLLG